MKKKSLLFLSLLVTIITYAQVGIGTVTPDPSSMLDIQSDSQGLLAPRMTTIQRNAITTPAESLLVFDTDEDSFYYYDSTNSVWVKINSSSNQRDNYVLVKSEDDFPDAGGGNIVLDTDTLYELNGEIEVSSSIELNGAYIIGNDVGEDILKFTGSGSLFTGSGGSIRSFGINANGQQVFDITNPGANNNLIFQNLSVFGASSIGTLSNFNIVFCSIIQYVGNQDGITLTDVNQVLFTNIYWNATNTGTFETLNGSFDIIQQQGGVIVSDNGEAGLNVSSNPAVTQAATLSNVTFTSTGTGVAVNGYGSGSYPGYNFTNDWVVDCPGIPKESDDVATGNIYYDTTNPAGVVSITNNTAFKLPVNTNAIRLFRITEGTAGNSENRIIYRGEKERALNVFGTVSFTATTGTRLGFSIYKNGALVTGTEAIVDVLQTNQRQTVSIIGTVSVDLDDYIEIYVRKLSAPNEDFLVTSYNLIVN
ncbi:hypothetical protein [uncultured Marixanthomonas sp.]|uniref:hypothetical protein n=1 Tax=uncultured Marixanthomonas sp. TaxID=757245 RepID=UPI0030DD94A2|tara:strand:- start:113528 stop:114961 length:1434 start_codon:yes stop_codon:yes gene_type:complete